MPAVALSRACARGRARSRRRGPGRLCLEALPDPRSPRGTDLPTGLPDRDRHLRFTAAGKDGFTAVGSGSGAAASRTWPGCAPRGTRSLAGARPRMITRSGWCWAVWTCGSCSATAWSATGAAGRRPAWRLSCSARRRAGQGAGPRSAAGRGGEWQDLLRRSPRRRHRAHLLGAAEHRGHLGSAHDDGGAGGRSRPRSGTGWQPGRVSSTSARPPEPRPRAGGNRLVADGAPA